MTDVTVKQFAEVVGVPPDRLLVQLGEAGLEVSDENATISDGEKTRLLDFLRQSHGKRSALSTGGVSKITLKRKTQTTILSRSTRIGELRRIAPSVTILPAISPSLRERKTSLTVARPIICSLISGAIKPLAAALTSSIAL